MSNIMRQPSVDLKSLKQPWGTITKPTFPLGHQTMDEEEINETVKRLYKISKPKERQYKRHGKTMEEDDIKQVVTRLTDVKKEKIPDSDRRVMSSPFYSYGVVSSFAWKGYN